MREKRDGGRGEREAGRGSGKKERGRERGREGEREGRRGRERDTTILRKVKDLSTSRLVYQICP